MSYILDALNKSQQQKDQAQAENTPLLLQQAPPPPTSSGSKWVWFIGTGLLAACFLFIWLIYQQMTQYENSVQRQAPSKLAAPNHTDKPKPVTHTQQPELVKPAKPRPIQHQVSQPPKPPVPKKTLTPKKPPTATQAKAPLAALKRIPKLEINSHIYSKLVDKRKVNINGRSYLQGEWITDEVQLHEITQHGIRLKLDGWFIDVGRSKGWQPL